MKDLRGFWKEPIPSIVKTCTSPQKARRRKPKRRKKWGTYEPVPAYLLEAYAQQHLAEAARIGPDHPRYADELRWAAMCRDDAEQSRVHTDQQALLDLVNLVCPI